MDKVPPERVFSTRRHAQGVIVRHTTHDEIPELRKLEPPTKLHVEDTPAPGTYTPKYQATQKTATSAFLDTKATRSNYKQQDQVEIVVTDEAFNATRPRISAAWMYPERKTVGAVKVDERNYDPDITPTRKEIPSIKYHSVRSRTSKLQDSIDVPFRNLEEAFTHILPAPSQGRFSQAPRSSRRSSDCTKASKDLRELNPPAADKLRYPRVAGTPVYREPTFQRSLPPECEEEEEARTNTSKVDTRTPSSNQVLTLIDRVLAATAKHTPTVAFQDTTLNPTQQDRLAKHKSSKRCETRVGPGYYNPQYTLREKKSSAALKMRPPQKAKGKRRTQQAIGPGTYAIEKADIYIRSRKPVVKFAVCSNCRSAPCKCPSEKIDPATVVDVEEMESDFKARGKSEEKDRDDKFTDDASVADAKYVVAEEKNYKEFDAKDMKHPYSSDSETESFAKWAKDEAKVETKHFLKKRTTSRAVALTIEPSDKWVVRKRSRITRMYSPTKTIVKRSTRKMLELRHLRRVQKPKGSYNIKYHLTERRIPGPLISQAESSRKKTERRNQAYHHFREYRLARKAQGKKPSKWYARQIHRPWVPVSADEDDYDRLWRRKQLVFQYRVHAARSLRPTASRARKQWLPTELHQPWKHVLDPTDMDNAILWEKQHGRDQIVVREKGQKKVLEFSRKPAATSWLGPGRYDASHVPTFDDYKAEGVDFSRVPGRKEVVGPFGERPEVAMIDDEEGAVLELDTDDRAIRPRIPGFSFRPPEDDYEDANYEALDDLVPDYDFGKKSVKGFRYIRLEKQIGRYDNQTQETHESTRELDLEVEFKAIEPRVKGLLGFDKMQGRKAPRRTKAAKGLEEDQDAQVYEGEALSLSPKYDLGWESAKGFIAMEKMFHPKDAAEELDARPSLLFADEAKTSIALAEGIISRYERSDKGLVSMDRDTRPRFSKEKAETTELYHQAEYDPKLSALGTKRNEKLTGVDMSRGLDRWEKADAKLEQSMEQLDLDVGEEYLSKRRRVTMSVNMSKVRSRFPEPKHDTISSDYIAEVSPVDRRALKPKTGLISMARQRGRGQERREEDVEQLVLSPKRTEMVEPRVKGGVSMRLPTSKSRIKGD